MRIKASLFALLAMYLTAAATAQTTVTLPDSSTFTQATADVTEQAQVTVPASVSFNVTNIGSSTPASAATVTVTNLVLATATKQLKISIEAGAASFTPPVGGTGTWAASDVTWNAATWTNATGASGTLSDSAFNEVATCAADASACSTTNLVFTVPAKASVNRAGNHTLQVTWKFESIGS